MFALKNIAEFLMIALVFWTIWTYQTVFANRFFENDSSSPLFLLFNMFWVAVLAQTIHENFELTYITFAGVTSNLFLSIAIQYYLKMQTVEDDETRILCNQISAILGLGSVIGFVTIFPWGSFQLRFTLCVLSIIIVASFPLIMRKSLQKCPTKFGHLKERFSLLTLLLFGEAVKTVARTIEYNQIAIESIFFFLLVLLLFLFYHTAYKSGVAEERETAGLVWIYSHYFVYTGLGMSSVIYANYIQGVVQSSHIVLTIGAALLFFFGGILANVIVYSKHVHDYQPFILKNSPFFVLWLVISFFTWKTVLLVL